MLLAISNFCKIRAETIDQAVTRIFRRSNRPSCRRSVLLDFSAAGCKSTSKPAADKVDWHRRSGVFLASSFHRHCDHCGLSAFDSGRGLLGFSSRLPRHEGLLPRRQHHAVVHPGNLQCIRHVRYQRDNAAGLLDVRLRAEERLDTVAVADLQPDIPDGVSVGVAAAIERDDRRGVD